MRRVLIAAALFGAAALATGALTADEPKKDAKATKKDIGKLMKETHKGEKSAHVRVEAELKKDSPDWEQVAKGTKSFAEMGDALTAAALPYVSPEKYVTSTKALTKAAGEKDKKAAAEAFTALTKSCSACHTYAGPGGTIR
jgi:hypothetical protein